MSSVADGNEVNNPQPEPRDQSQSQVSETSPANEVENSNLQNESQTEGPVSSAEDQNEVNNTQQKIPAGGLEDQSSSVAENPQGLVQQAGPQPNSPLPGHHNRPSVLVLQGKRSILTHPSHRNQGSTKQPSFFFFF